MDPIASNAPLSSSLGVLIRIEWILENSFRMAQPTDGLSGSFLHKILSIISLLTESGVFYQLILLIMRSNPYEIGV